LSSVDLNDGVYDFLFPIQSSGFLIIQFIIPSLSIFFELRPKATINKMLKEIIMASNRGLIPISERLRQKRYCMVCE